MSNRDPHQEETYSEEEIAKRRDEGLRRLLKMRPKPHAEIAGKKKAKAKRRGKGTQAK